MALTKVSGDLLDNNISFAGIITATTANFTDVTVSGDLTVQGTTTTLDTVVTEVDKLEVGANNSTVGVAITQSGSGDILRLYDGATQVVTVKDGGSVGVGTDNPQDTLDVASAVPQIRLTDLSDGSYGQVRANGGNLILRADEGNTVADSVILAEIDGDEKVRISSSGNIGIRTTSPTRPLTVAAGSGESVNILGVFDTRFANPATVGNSVIAFSDPTSTAGQFSTRLGSVGDSLAFYTNGSNERMRITSAGFVGLGVTDPAEELEISASGGCRIALNRTGNDGYAYLGTGTTNDLQFGRDGSGSLEYARFDISGRFLVGTSTAPSAGNGQYSKFVVQGGNGTTEGDISIQRNENAANITSGENIGYINFNDNTGNTFGVIRCFADGNAQASNDFPGAFRFETTANGSGTPTEGMRITRDNEVNINDPSGVYNLDGYTNAKLFVYDVRLGGHAGTFVNNHVSYNQSNHGVLWSGCSRSASSGYVLFAATSGNGNSLNYGADYEFRLYGDGNGKCDGSWTGGGADYAEMFEWVDGNPDAEDRRGLSVVLEGNKIRTAVAGEDPIGVISANPTILGDASWNKWTEKHLRDDFGSYILQEHNVVEWTDEEGKEHNYEDWNIPADVVVPDDAVITTHDGNGKRFTHRAVNPAYDPDREYIPREERQEWDAVGLMGKLRIRKGQITGARWIKMRDISDNVEEWLVR